MTHTGKSWTIEGVLYAGSQGIVGPDKVQSILIETRTIPKTPWDPFPPVFSFLGRRVRVTVEYLGELEP